LGDIGRELGATGRGLGWVPTMTQVGYASGMLLIVPLGDSLERRRVIITMTGLVSLALMGAALAPSLGWMVAASFAVGITAAGSWLGTTAWVRFGWPGVCLVGGSMALMALIVLRAGGPHQKRP